VVFGCSLEPVPVVLEVALLEVVLVAAAATVVVVAGCFDLQQSQFAA
jgi:hypothetical protein